MKRFITTICAIFFSLALAFAQADKILGVYTYTTTSQEDNVTSKIKISKANGGYCAQVIWVDKLYKADGSKKTDIKNPDKSKQNIPIDQIVLIEKISYNAKDKSWENGKIYEPTTGKTYKVTCSFDNDKTLKVRGYIGFAALGRTVLWKKIE
ncbi:MAG: DUF2147 domain-containing protein [Bacteroidales bacterium]|nr:DUF2147 domain-containing protein [Bacteroidales bacterium]